MEIKKIEIGFVTKSGFESFFCDKICHVKTLPYLSVVQAVCGNYDIKLGNGEFFNTKEKGFFLAPASVQQTIIHNTEKESNKMVCRWIFIKVKINDVYDFDSLFDFPVILPEEYKAEMNEIFEKLFASSNAFDEYICYYEIIKLLSKVKSPKQHEKPLQVESAIAFIKANFCKNVMVKDIADAVLLSESRFYSIFKKEMGVSPIAYLNNYRLSLASEALLKSNKSITEIAESVGIFDSVYFNKLFRKTYQLSPSQYRKMYKTLQ
ncbi:MAG: helix-turn-helix transcriptional regulator [Clostridia bacterium]|nr:helix-turn-helix transcriptional regulator [Clostridia bacterium]